MNRLVTALFVVLLWCTAHARQIIVTAGGPLRSIKEALLLADHGDSVIVRGGLYRENNLVIDKAIHLIGEDQPVIDGEFRHHMLTVTADHVLISGMVFQNSGVSYIQENAAIKLDGVKHCRIIANRFINNFFAIYLAKSEHCQIIDNEIRSRAQRESAAGNGIHLWYCKTITIEKNRIQGHRDGIYFEFVEDGTILGNSSERNLRYGLHFMFSNNCRYRNNYFRDNGAGVAVMYTKHVLMENNRFENNWGPAAYGLLLKDISDSHIRGNHFLKNTVGIYAEGSNRNRIHENSFDGNGWAIRLMANCLENTFSANSFVKNSFDVATNSRQNFNQFSGNYWSRYKGYDLDRDGVGDVPFRPVRLFSIIAERQQPAIILLHSFFIHLLEIAEAVFPILTPETLIDEQPLMRNIL